MSLAHYILLPLLCLFQLALRSAQESTEVRPCHSYKPFQCGSLGQIQFPFFRIEDPKCAVIAMNCSAREPEAQFEEKGVWYVVNYINLPTRRIEVHDQDVQNYLESKRCNLLDNFTEQAYLKTFSEDEYPYFISFNITETRPFFKCICNPNFTSEFVNQSRKQRCNNYTLYYYMNQQQSLPPLSESLSNCCSVVQLPSSSRAPDDEHSLTSLWKANFTIHWEILPACTDCAARGGHCQIAPNKSFTCGEKHITPDESRKKGRNVGLKVKIGVGAAAGSILLTCIAFTIYQLYKRKRSSNSLPLISPDLSCDDSLELDPEKERIFSQTQLFTYKELEEATNHFDGNRKIGDGGFGAVYHGKLRDGRVVAVKRLFEHNSKRVEQFINEVAILWQLRHKNLVPLYGCTSRHGRELLLVYEFVSNGTVADHIHGELAGDSFLTWPVRMSIAIQTADALTYLHASKIIHRDVKSSNILLDKNFQAKVADFGLSRLFPADVTHVSTAPQGTPGYVDPEYHQCYQLNNRSDVYSFGVVLIELISSKPAVDITRNRHEINLANMAVNKIYNQALHELVDPSLGYDTDYNVRNMITLVAELAFRCLQQDNEMRPSMTEVLEVLRGIENGTDDTDTSAVAQLLQNHETLSPDTVTGTWSSNTTPNTSG